MAHRPCRGFGSAGDAETFISQAAIHCSSAARFLTPLLRSVGAVGYRLLMEDAAMAEFSPSERLFKAVLGTALLSAWWYYAPDYLKFFSTPLGKLTLDDI